MMKTYFWVTKILEIFQVTKIFGIPYVAVIVNDEH